ncbi:MAG: hypothetical protein IT178_01200 [Acidobacteria bacterium]|nr:hypothetical protein [Acidobacteriota bacterium]
MDCNLKRRKSDGVFVGKAGQKVCVDLVPDDGKPASLVQLFYAGESDGTAPFEFTIVKGSHKLLVVASGVDGEQRMKIVERAGDAECFLRRFFWSPSNFHTTLDIEGK